MRDWPTDIPASLCLQGAAWANMADGRGAACIVIHIVSSWETVILSHYGPARPEALVHRPTAAE